MACSTPSPPTPAAAGIERITLSVESGNGAASELYRSVGYQTVSTRDDGQTMVLDLVEG